MDCSRIGQSVSAVLQPIADQRRLGFERGPEVATARFRNDIASVDADAKADGPIGELVTVIGGNLLLHLYGTAHRTVDAVEHDEEGVTSCVNDSAAILVDCRVEHSPAESPEPIERSYVIQPNETTVTDHVSIDHGDQLPTAWRSSDL
jgi:hypothetical protein